MTTCSSRMKLMLACLVMYTIVPILPFHTSQTHPYNAFLAMKFALHCPLFAHLLENKTPVARPIEYNVHPRVLSDRNSPACKQSNTVESGPLADAGVGFYYGSSCSMSRDRRPGWLPRLRIRNMEFAPGAVLHCTLMLILLILLIFAMMNTEIENILEKILLSSHMKTKSAR